MEAPGQTMTILKNLATLLSYLTVSALSSLAFSAVVFLVTAAVVGFISWIFGADSPRDVAVLVSAVFAALTAISLVVHDVFAYVVRFNALRTQMRVEQILGSDG